MIRVVLGISPLIIILILSILPCKSNLSPPNLLPFHDHTEGGEILYQSIKHHETGEGVCDWSVKLLIDEYGIFAHNKFVEKSYRCIIRATTKDVYGLCSTLPPIWLVRKSVISKCMCVNVQYPFLWFCLIPDTTLKSSFHPLPNSTKFYFLHTHECKVSCGCVCVIVVFLHPINKNFYFGYSWFHNVPNKLWTSVGQRVCCHEIMTRSGTHPTNRSIMF